MVTEHFDKHDYNLAGIMVKSPAKFLPYISNKVANYMLQLAKWCYVARPQPIMLLEMLLSKILKQAYIMLKTMILIPED